jgi:hypothetical protein
LPLGIVSLFWPLMKYLIYNKSEHGEIGRHAAVREVVTSATDESLKPSKDQADTQPCAR